MDALQSWPPEDNGETLALIRRSAKRLLRKTHLPATELDEIEQVLTVDLWRSSKSCHKAPQQWPAHARTVLKQSACRFMRHRCTKKRDPRRCRSLNVNVQDEHGTQTEFASTVRSDEVRKHLGVYPEPSEQVIDAKHDAQVIVSKLPIEWQEPIAMLSEGSLSEVANKTGVSRTTINSRLKRVRGNFPNYFSL